MPLDATGFSIPTYDELVAQGITKTKQLFGDDWDTSSNSVTGMWLRDIAWHLSVVYQDAQDVYLAGFLDQATGNDLDLLGRNYNVTRNAANPAQALLTFTGTPKYIIESDSDSNLFGTADGYDFQLMQDLQLDADGHGSAIAECTQTGDDTNVGANTINICINQDADIQTVNNPKAAAGGANLEDDESYRQRIYLSMESKASPTFSGLYSALYTVPGVKQVQIVPNLSMQTDEYGNPPKSLHFFLEGGGQQDIADTILKNIAAGIQTVGEVKTVSYDDSQHAHDIYYSEATTQLIYVSMVINVDPDFNVIDGEAAIRSAIKSYLSTLIMGDLLVFTKLYQAIYNVDGVNYVEVKVGTDPNNLVQKDIQLGSTATPIINSDNDIEVQINEE